MSKIKMTVRTPRIDMTPMVDLFFLLLTFFMLTTSFRPQEAAQVDTPTSVSENLAPEKDVMTIFIDKAGKVYFNLDNGLDKEADTSLHTRSRVLEEMAKQMQVKFTPEQIAKFEKLSSFGMPVKKMPAWIDAESAERDTMNSGIPIDSLNNELIYWLLYTRRQNNSVKVAIKGDANADYKVVNKVFDMMKENKIYKFNLTTNLEKVEIKPEDLNF